MVLHDFQFEDMTAQDLAAALVSITSTAILLGSTVLAQQVHAVRDELNRRCPPAGDRLLRSLELNPERDLLAAYAIYEQWAELYPLLTREEALA